MQIFKRAKEYVLVNCVGVNGRFKIQVAYIKGLVHTYNHRDRNGSRLQILCLLFCLNHPWEVWVIVNKTYRGITRCIISSKLHSEFAFGLHEHINIMFIVCISPPRVSVYSSREKAFMKYNAVICGPLY